VIAPADHPVLQGAAAILEEAGHAVSVRALDGLDDPALVVESPYVLAILLAAERWNDAETTVAAAQVALANWATALDDSPRRWDLYVVTLLRGWPETPEEGASIEQAESSTELARKVVRSNVNSEDDVRRALRPLLPLRPVGRAALPDVSVALEERLRIHGIEGDLAAAAVSGFLQSGAVRL
jgi:hypothetical protein